MICRSVSQTVSHDLLEAFKSKTARSLQSVGWQELKQASFLKARE